MGLGQIGQNGVEEFAETIFYGLAYEEAKNKLKDFTSDVDSELMQDALSSAGTIIVSGIMFQLMRTQEGFIDDVFQKSKVLIGAILGSQVVQRMKGRTIGRLKGTKLFKKLKFLQGSLSDRIGLANLVSQFSAQHFEADKSTSQDLEKLNVNTHMKQTMLQKESLNLNVAESITKNFNETLILKLATKSFSEKDRTMLKKILGRELSGDLSIDDMNQVADFMFTKDTNGNITGLSEQLFSIINGLGYMHNK